MLIYYIGVVEFPVLASAVAFPPPYVALAPLPVILDESTMVEPISLSGGVVVP